MSKVTDLEQQILALPADEFMHVRDVVYEREQALLNEHGVEDDPALEAALLKGLEGPRIAVDETFYASIRESWKKKSS